MKIPISCLNLRDNIEKFIFNLYSQIKNFDDLDNFQDWQLTYKFEEISVKIWPTVIGKFGRNDLWIGMVEYDIQNTPNKLIEKGIHEIFKEFNDKYYNKKFYESSGLSCMIKCNPIA